MGVALDRPEHVYFECEDGDSLIFEMPWWEMDQNLSDPGRSGLLMVRRKTTKVTILTPMEIDRTFCGKVGTLIIRGQPVEGMMLYSMELEFANQLYKLHFTGEQYIPLTPEERKHLFDNDPYFS